MDKEYDIHRRRSCSGNGRFYGQRTCLETHLSDIRCGKNSERSVKNTLGGDDHDIRLGVDVESFLSKHVFRNRHVNVFRLGFLQGFGKLDVVRWVRVGV